MHGADMSVPSKCAEHSVVIGAAMTVFIFAACYLNVAASRVDLDPHVRRLAKYDVPSIHGMVSDDDMSALLARFKKPSGQYMESIAIVGSSGNLLYRGRGREIDQHDVIMRVNGAVTRSYENDSGRDPHQIVVGFDKGLRDAMRHHVLCCGAMAIVTTNNIQKGVRRSWAGNNAAVVVNTSFMEKVHGALAFERHWPSTGFLALVIGLAVGRHIGARVSVYGFGACVPCNKYFDCARALGSGAMYCERAHLLSLYICLSLSPFAATSIDIYRCTTTHRDSYSSHCCHPQ